MTKVLEAEISEELSMKELYQLNHTMQHLDTLQNFSAIGFFSISRSTLRGMCSAAITYLIILVQFRKGTPVTPHL